MQHHIDVVSLAAAIGGRCSEIAAENRRQRPVVGEIEITDRRDGDVDINGIEPRTEHALGDATAQDVARPRIVGVPHIAFRVHDIAASRHFYKDFLGYAEPFDINGPDGKLIMAFIKINDRQYVELQVENSPDEPE